jgi:hypothetical protein
MNLTAELLGFLSLWPLWLFLIAVATFVFVTRPKPTRGPMEALDQQTQDQRNVNSIANFGVGNDL